MAERAGDPAPAVYARLFARFPAMEPLFWRDTDGSIRGEMLAMALNCLLSLDGAYGANFIRAERLSHEGFEVPPEAFASFFPVVMETCREILGEAWTDAFQTAWDDRLRRISGLIAGA